VNAESSCLDAEALASFVDGSLGVRDLKAAVEHLADCAHCYEVALEALYIREVEGESHPYLRLVRTRKARGEGHE